jgi:hypothetical protein
MGCIYYRWTFERLRELLLPHRHTLRELRVRQLGPSQEGLELFNIHPFEALHTLQLCALLVSPPDKACDLWLTPNLHRLILESSWTDSQCGIIWYWGQENVAWLAAFAKIAADRKRSGVSDLCIIEFICETNDDEYQCMTGSEDTCVEGQLSSAKAVVEMCGFDFIWRRAIQLGETF